MEGAPAGRCPDCGEPAPAGVPPGKAYACPRCRNPVLAVAGAATAVAIVGRGASPAATDAPDAGVAEAPPRPRPAWVLALAAFVVLGTAYVGVYALLTASARRERASLLRTYGETARTAQDPGDPPATGVADWKRRHDLWDARKRIEALDKQVNSLFGALLAAFAVQTAVTGVILAKTAGRRGAAREPGATRKPRSPGSSPRASPAP